MYFRCSSHNGTSAALPRYFFDRCACFRCRVFLLCCDSDKLFWTFATWALCTLCWAAVLAAWHPHQQKEVNVDCRAPSCFSLVLRLFCVWILVALRDFSIPLLISCSKRSKFGTPDGPATKREINTFVVLKKSAFVHASNLGRSYFSRTLEILTRFCCCSSRAPAQALHSHCMLFHKECPSGCWTPCTSKSNWAQTSLQKIWRDQRVDVGSGVLLRCKLYLEHGYHRKCLS